MSAAAIGGFAFITPPWAFGARAGVSFLERGYARAAFMYHPPKLLPESDDLRWYTGVEAGFETGVFPKTRIFMGAGYGSHETAIYGAIVNDARLSPPPARGSLVLWPGVAVLFPIGPAFAGVDARVILWTRSDRALSQDNPFAPSISVTAGAGF